MYARGDVGTYRGPAAGGLGAMPEPETTLNLQVNRMVDSIDRLAQRATAETALAPKAFMEPPPPPQPPPAVTPLPLQLQVAPGFDVPRGAAAASPLSAFSPAAAGSPPLARSVSPVARGNGFPAHPRPRSTPFGRGPLPPPAYEDRTMQLANGDPSPTFPLLSKDSSIGGGSSPRRPMGVVDASSAGQQRQQQPADALLSSLLKGLEVDSLSVVDVVSVLDTDLKKAKGLTTVKKNTGSSPQAVPVGPSGRWVDSSVISPLLPDVLPSRRLPPSAAASNAGPWSGLAEAAEELPAAAAAPSPGLGPAMPCERCLVVETQLRAVAQSLAGLSAALFNWTLASTLRHEERGDVWSTMLKYVFPCAELDVAVAAVCDSLKDALDEQVRSRQMIGAGLSSKTQAVGGGAGELWPDGRLLLEIAVPAEEGRLGWSVRWWPLRTPCRPL
eukprot:TRINITY_DN16753_c1_g1_i5.p1 TRINITY_DN16753_c1_g1~~TRINITY_DN16753_c1_g1_i5.p1  ORF type:complete len:443 (-),score=96.66 TRINITY_DN16753_c1_g1_i5:287-1615(-)